MISYDNPTLLLIHAITGLYLNRKLSAKNAKIISLVKKLIAKMKMPTAVQGEGTSAEVSNALKMTLDWLLGTPDSVSVRLVELKERVRINCSYSDDYLETLENLLAGMDEADEDTIRANVESIVSQIEYAGRRLSFADSLAKLSRDINYGTGYIDLDEALEKTREFLSEAEVGGATKLDKSNQLDLDDLDHMVELFQSAVENLSYEGILKTGLKGLNKMWGVGGYVRGLSYLYTALTHNYKTGILLDNSRWICQYNKPHMWDETKKPLVLRISFENKPEQDIITLFTTLWEKEHGKKCDLAEIDIREAATYVRDRMTANGYHFKMLCFDPNGFDIWKIIDILSGYEAEGYEIHALITDYLELITKGGSSTMRTDERIMYTFETLRNHCFGRGITQINAHQLNSEAATMATEGTANFAKKAAMGNYCQNARILNTKMDGYCAMHIHVREDGLEKRKFLTFYCGKNRTSKDTPLKHLGFAVEFQHYGLPDDEGTDKDSAIYEWSSVSLDTVNNKNDTEKAFAGSEEAW